MTTNMFDLEPLVPCYTFKFPFEAYFQPRWTQRWMENNWTISLYLAAGYLCVVVYNARKVTLQAPRASEPSSRSVFSLEFLWNGFLSLFHTLGVFRTFPELWHSLWYFGLHHTVCDSEYLDRDQVAAFWTFACALSKVLELGDTFLFVLKGQPVSFLHVFHNASVLVLNWYIYSYKMAALRWFVCMNFLVHALIYAYLGLRLLTQNVPKSLASATTVLQITRLIVGMYIILYAYLCWWMNAKCDVTPFPALVILSLHVIHLVLVVEFFYSRHMTTKMISEKKKQ